MRNKRMWSDIVVFGLPLGGETDAVASRDLSLSARICQFISDQYEPADRSSDSSLVVFYSFLLQNKGHVLMLNRKDSRAKRELLIICSLLFRVFTQSLSQSNAAFSPF